MNNIDGDNITLIESETNIFKKNIDILKSWRETLGIQFLKELLHSWYQI